MVYKYTPQGVCSREFVIDINDEDDTINSVKIVGGCAGNTVGVSRLCEGRKIDDVIKLLKGIPCGFKGTSCPDQLAIALETYKKEKR